MSALVNLRTQVKNVLRLRHGGLGNQRGLARGVVKLCSNRTGGDLPLYSLVRLQGVYNDARVELTDTDAELTVVGVVAGYFDPDSPEDIITEDAPDLSSVAVITYGTARVLVATAGATRGEYAYAAGGGDDGMAYSDAAPLAGAFGVFQGSGTSGGTALVRLYGSASSSSGGGATFGTPAIVLGTSAAAGSVDEVIRRDSTIVAFDTTDPSTLAFGDSPDDGAAAVAARRDHVHGMPGGPPAGTVALGLYGNGHDGDLVLDGSVTPSTNLMTKSGSVYTLSRDAFWDNLTVDAGVTLITNGLKFFCRESLEVNGTVHRNGNNGVNQTAGAALSQLTTGASQAGGNGATTDANGSNGNAVSTNGSAGGPAGNGGISGTGRTGGTGGSARDNNGATVNAPGQGGLSSTSNTRGRPLTAVGFMLGFWSIGGAASQFWEGGAGAGGGGRGPSAGTAGGGGGGGGVVVICAAEVTVGSTGVISANGGNGANGAGTNAGGGGGGGGGVVAIMTDSYTVVSGGAVTATGGNFGTGAGGGGNGGAGGDGNVYVLLNV